MINLNSMVRVRVQDMRILIILSILFSLSILAFCQEDPRIDLVCEFEDYYDFEAFKYVDTLLYVANRYGLFIYSYNENNMENLPVELVRYKTRGEAESLLIVDTLCYLADGYAGLRILDISDIYNIREIGYCEDAAGGQFLQLQDGVLYMACGRSGFRSVDISDPTNPVLLQTLDEYSEDFRIHNNLVYSASDDHRYLDIFDISDPADMQSYRDVYFERIENGQGIEIHDDYLYYVTDEKFRILSIANPDTLDILYEGDYGMRVAANTVRHFNEHYLYMDSHRVWDVEDPVSPVILFGDWIELFSHWSEVAERVSLSCNTFTSDKRGLIIYNIENLRNIEEIHYLPSLMGLSDVFIQGDLLYTSSKYKIGSKFDIYNIGDIYNPFKIGEIDSTEGGGNCNVGFDGITVQNDLAVLWAWDSRDAILLYSVEDPGHPAFLSEIDHISPRDIFVDGNYIYAACDDLDGLKVISFEDPEHPDVVWEVLPPEDNPFSFYGVNVTADYAYTVTRGRGEDWSEDFYIWNKSDPTNLELLGKCEAEGFEGNVAVNGDYAYVTAVTGGGGILSVISIENPTEPELVNTIQLFSYSPRDCFLENEYLYIAYNKIGFSIFSLEDPAQPELLTWFDTPYSSGGFSYYNHLFVRDSYVFLPGMIYDIARVTGRWNMELSAKAHDFGVVHLNTDSTFQLTIRNLARQDVEILDISCDSAAFTVDFDTTFTIEPGEEATVDVTFTPTEQRLYTGKLTIHTGRRDLTVELSGTGVDLSVTEDELLPLEFKLYPAYPNPFNSTTTLRFDLPRSRKIFITITDLTGRRIATLLKDPLTAGQHKITWEAKDYSTGMYLCKMEADGFRQVIKMVLVK